MNRTELEKRAASLGIKPGTLRQRMYREDLRKKALAKSWPEFETFGLRLSPAFVRELDVVRKKLEAIALRIGTARLDVERLAHSKLPAPVKQLESLVGVILSLEGRIAECMPRSLCPYCKGIDQLQEDCRSCARTGLASVAQFNAAPRRLKEADVVMSEGKEAPLSDFSVPARSGPLGEPA